MTLRNQKVLWWLFASVCLGSVACTPKDTSTSSATKVSDDRPNVLLVTFDTTRPDYLGPYGAKRAFTPNLNALAKRGFKFNRAFSSAPITQPSHTTIMTGLFPFYHGVRDNAHFVLKPEAVTLAEVLKDHGYQTAAIVAAFVLDGRFGLNQGFDVYDDKVPPKSEFEGFQVPERNGEAISNAAIKWLDGTADDKPYFLWAHYYDPHAPYAAPESFTRYRGFPYAVEIAYADMQLGRLLARVAELDTARHRDTLIVFTSDHGEALEQYGEPTHAYFAYDSTLHVPLIIRLPGDRHGGGQSDVVVSLADIMPTILDEVGVSGPGPEDMHGRTLRSIIETGETPDEFTDRAIAFESYEPHFDYGWAALEGIRIGERKFIFSPKPELYLLDKNSRETPANNLYDKMPDLAAQMKSAYQDLFDGELSFAPFTSTPQAPDAEVTEKLRALGYVAATLPEERDPHSGKDVKDMLPYYRKVLSAMSLIGGGQATEAAKLLIALQQDEPENDRVLWMLAQLAADTPKIVGDVSLPIIEKAIATPGRLETGVLPQFMVSCGRIHLSAGRDERAYAYFSDALAAQENYVEAAWWKAVTAMRLGRPADALTAIELTNKLYKNNVPKARATLGLILFLNARADEGTRVWSEMMGATPNTSAVWTVASLCPRDGAIARQALPVLLPQINPSDLPDHPRAALGILCSYYQAILGQHDDALATLRQIQPLLPEGDLEYKLATGRELLQLGQVAEARRLLEACYAQQPNRVEVVTALAGLMEQAGEVDEAVELLERLYEHQGEDTVVMNNLAWMLATQGKDPGRAVLLINRVLDHHSSDANANDTAGWIYRKLGDKEMAERFHTRAVQIDPNNAEFQYHLGVALREVGKIAKSQIAFAKAVELAPARRPPWFDEAARGATGP